LFNASNSGIFKIMKLPILFAVSILTSVAITANAAVANKSAPVSLEVLTVTPKAAGQKGGFTYRIASQSDKPIAKILLEMEFRDADGILEKSVPHTRQKDLAPGAKAEEKSDDFFMSEATRNVTLKLRDVEFGDGKKWSARETALAAAAPGPLSFAGHAAPAKVEVLRFRPKKGTPKGGVAWRLVNQSNKAIEAVVFDVAFMDDTGKVEKSVPHGNSRGGDLAIGPGATLEGSMDAFFMTDKSTSARFTLKSLTFAGGEKWEAAK
jgi:hypothetical protein